ncbi:MAG: hypothetical protein U0172_01330 [Nitrospiraceae bacterium]
MSRRMRWGLVALLTAEWLALACWVGGLTVLIAAAIPAVFNTFGGQDSGGLFLTKAFEGYNRVVMGAVVVLVVGMVIRHGIVARRVPWLRPTRLAWVLLGIMVAIAGAIIFVMHPDAAARQAEAFAIHEGPARKAALEQFFKLHQPMRILYMVNWAVGVGLAAATVWPWVTRDEARG